ncbi:MAG: hypothetical protein Q8P53_04095 [Candidatus Shapirobacteria bacterium]|nr:hypothetical protein [Candidatus Shapirobacteria bacterium]
MRLVFLNTWYGKINQPLVKFIEKESQNTDVFCFQEASEKVRWFLKNNLSNYTLITDYKYIDNDDDFPQSTYIKNTLKINTNSTILSDEPNSGLCVYTQIQNENKIINLCNVHGISKPGNKLDTPGRIKQSQIIIDFMKNVAGPKVIGGDFNLELNTESVKMFEDNGYINLIKEFNISTTRNELAWKKYPDNKQYFADYIFVSPDIKVINFSVPNIEISDHLPLILEIE